MANYKEFDPTDDADILADMFRQEVCTMAERAMKLTAYQDLTPTQQLETFMGGVLVGLVNVCFAHVQEQGRGEMMKAIKSYLPQARDQTEAMLKEMPSAASDKHAH